MQMLIAIAAGGSLGALSRHFMAGAITRMLGIGFPYGTFAVNLLGSFLMGLLVTAFAARFEVSQELRSFITVGFLGSFTTFSTYSLETVLLIERGEWATAALYAFGSLALGVAGLFVGIYVGRVLV